MLTLILTVVIFVFVLGFVGVVKQRLEKRRHPNKPPFGVRHPKVFNILDWGSLVAAVVISFMLAKHFLKSPVQSEPSAKMSVGGSQKAVSPANLQPKLDKDARAVAAGDTTNRAEQENLATSLDDSVRNTGYHEHIFPGKDDGELVFISDMFRDDDGKAMFLSVTLPGWKAGLCSVGFTSVTLKSGVVSFGDTYPVGC